MKQTPSQTIGPYFAYSLTPEQYFYDFKSMVSYAEMNPAKTKDGFFITGKVYDGSGQTIPDAMVEIWKNDTEFFGRYGTGTDSENRFVFFTTKPKVENNKAPFISLFLFMRGQLIHSYTRIYFDDEAELNNQDADFLSIPSERRGTLLAKKTANGYEFDIYMQGENETVFFEV